MMTKEQLLDAAREVLPQAYVPYSHFPVASAVLYRDGRVVTGVNVENASFGATNCAERTAIFAGVTLGYRPGDIEAVAVVGKTEGFLPPCCVCRQVLLEFCDPTTPVYLTNQAGDIMTLTVAELAPYAFTTLNM